MKRKIRVAVGVPGECEIKSALYDLREILEREKGRFRKGSYSTPVIDDLTCRPLDLTTKLDDVRILR